jgi:hypothetical protein
MICDLALIRTAENFRQLCTGEMRWVHRPYFEMRNDSNSDLTRLGQA